MAGHSFKRGGPGFTARQKTGRYKRGSGLVSGRLVKGLVEYYFDTRHEKRIFYPLEGKVDTLRSLLRPHIDETFGSQDLLDAVTLQLTLDSRDSPIYDAHSLLDPLVMALHSYDYNNFYLDLTTLAPYQADLAKSIRGRWDDELSVTYKCNVVSFGRSVRDSSLGIYGEVYLGAYAGASSEYVFHGPVALAGCRTSGCYIYLQSANPITPNSNPAAVLRFDELDIRSAADMVLMDTTCPAFGSNFYVSDLELSDKERIASTFFSKLGNTLLMPDGNGGWTDVTLA